MKPASRFRPAGALSPQPSAKPPPGPIMRMRRAPFETAEEGAERAKSMPWWPRVKRERPYSSTAWWIWAVRAS